MAEFDPSALPGDNPLAAPPVVAEAITYDLTTPAGRVRLLITDTDPTSAVFSDAEILAFLFVSQQSIYEAAALAYETWARSQAKLDVIVKIGGAQTQREAADTLLALAATLRKNKPRRAAAVGQLAAPQCLPRPRFGFPFR